MSKKLLAVILTLALLAGGVGLGIHLLHREVYATNHVVFVKNVTDPENPEFVANVPVTISVETAPGIMEDDEGFTDVDGKFASQLAPHAGADHWEAVIEIPGGFVLVWGNNPRDVDYPSFTTFFDIALGD